MGKMLQRQTIYFFSNNTLHSLFSHVELFLNGNLISSSNKNYSHTAFVETELTTDPVSKGTWTVCQSYRYRPKNGKNLELENKIMKNFADNGTCSLYAYADPHVDCLDSERFLLPGVTLHLRIYRSSNLCALETLTDLDADDKYPPVL